MEALSGACPALTFQVSGLTVYTSAATEFKKGPCKDVQNGMAVVVEGRRMSDGRVRGDKVELGSTPPNGGERVELDGRIESLTGTCPSLIFQVRGATVYTTSGTRFKGGRCESAQNGDRVRVKGRRQADGRVLAEEVEVDDDDDDNDDDDNV